MSDEKKEKCYPGYLSKSTLKGFPITQEYVGGHEVDYTNFTEVPMPVQTDIRKFLCDPCLAKMERLERLIGVTPPPDHGLLCDRCIAKIKSL
jgi:hypothetical protein